MHFSFQSMSSYIIQTHLICLCFLFSRVQKDSENGSLSNKSRKKNEEKININIFLAQNVPELELELGSDSEGGGRRTNCKTVRLFENLIKTI